MLYSTIYPQKRSNKLWDPSCKNMGKLLTWPCKKGNWTRDHSWKMNLSLKLMILTWWSITGLKKHKFWNRLGPIIYCRGLFFSYMKEGFSSCTWSLDCFHMNKLNAKRRFLTKSFTVRENSMFICQSLLYNGLSSQIQSKQLYRIVWKFRILS